MKRKIYWWDIVNVNTLIVAVVTAIVAVAWGPTAKADLSFDNGKLRYSFNARNVPGKATNEGGMSAYASVGMTGGNFEHVSMGIHPRYIEVSENVWKPSETHGHLNFNVGGRLGPVIKTGEVNQALNINAPSMKLWLDEFVSMFTSREGEGGIGKGGAPVGDENMLAPAAPPELGKLWAHANGSLWTQSFILDGQARAYYDEYTSGGETEGNIFQRFSAGFSVPIVAIGGFTIPPEGAAFASVPEPMSASILGLGAFGLMGRRRRR